MLVITIKLKMEKTLKLLEIFHSQFLRKVEKDKEELEKEEVGDLQIAIEINGDKIFVKIDQLRRVDRLTET